MRILVYSPTVSEADPLVRIMRQCAFHVDTCDSEERLHYLAMTERYAAVLVKGSLSLEGMSSIFTTWKNNGCTGLFTILTPVSSQQQRAKLLEKGVNRYFIEPCSYTLLVSEILRHEYKATTPDGHIHTTTHFELDLLRRTVRATGQLVELTKIEFELLALFLRRRGIVLSRMQIWEEIWGYEDYPLANTVDVHINRLRKKLPPAAKALITTVYGIGYRMQSDA